MHAPFHESEKCIGKSSDNMHTLHAQIVFFKHLCGIAITKQSIHTTESTYCIMSPESFFNIFRYNTSIGIQYLKLMHGIYNFLNKKSISIDRANNQLTILQESPHKLSDKDRQDLYEDYLSALFLDMSNKNLSASQILQDTST